MAAALSCAPPKTPAAAPRAPPDDTFEVAELEAPEQPSAVSSKSAPALLETEAAEQPEQPDDDLDADIAALSAEARAPGRDPLVGHEIVYRVTPGGLVIEIEGLHLVPRAKPFRNRNGTYGIVLSLEAKSYDGRRYGLSTPEEGVMSIAGRVEAPDGKRARFGDQRRGEGQTWVSDADGVRLEQRWPGIGQPSLRRGQTISLEIGLWGLRVEEDRQKPIKKLFLVKMLGARRPQAVITPPTVDWGQ